MVLHLTVIQPYADANPDLEPTQAGKLRDFGGRYDCRWNDDFTAFRAVRLRWWDDASYAAYQAGDDERPEDLVTPEEYERNVAELAAYEAEREAERVANDDGLPF